MANGKNLSDQKKILNGNKLMTHLESFPPIKKEKPNKEKNGKALDQIRKYFEKKGLFKKRKQL